MQWPFGKPRSMGACDVLDVDHCFGDDAAQPTIMAGRALSLLVALLPAAASAYSNTHPVLAWSSRGCVRFQPPIIQVQRLTHLF